MGINDFIQTVAPPPTVVLDTKVVVSAHLTEDGWEAAVLLLGLAARRVMKLDQGQPAWDIHFAFDRDIEWTDEPPAPTDWMHQLKLDPNRK